MFLECSKVSSTVPKSNHVALVFPLSQVKFTYKRHLYSPQALDSERYTQEKINEVLDQIQIACKQFRQFRIYRNIFFVIVTILLIGIIVGNILLNIGLGRNDNPSGSVDQVKLYEYNTDLMTYAGGVVLALGVFQFGLILCCLSRRVKTQRIRYEQKVHSILTRHNIDLKEKGIRWKVGRNLLWLELSLDYKISESALGIGNKSNNSTKLKFNKTATQEMQIGNQV